MSRQGYTLTALQVNEYALRAKRSQRLSISDPLRNLAIGERFVRRDTPLMWLYRVQWIDLVGPSKNFEDDDEVKITPLGRAALAALDEAAASAQDQPASTIVLDREDPIALSKVIGKIAELGPCALIDRYFREEAFLPIAQRTEVQRILMGPEPRARVAAIEQALVDYKIDRSFEVRVDDKDEYHDRYVIPVDGPVWALGTSVSGVGDRHSALVEIKDEPVVRDMRANFARVWGEARQLNPPEERKGRSAEKRAEVELAETEAEPTKASEGSEGGDR